MIARRLPARSRDDVDAMARAGRVVARTLAVLGEAIVPGARTIELDALAAETIRGQGAVPSFPGVPGYRHTLCVSVNEEVVHGVPGPRALREGDLVSIDCGAVVGGWHGDAARTFVVGGPRCARDEDRRLLEVATEALWAGIAAFTPGGRLHDVGSAVERVVARAGGDDGVEYGILDGYEGHGIGRAMHLPPGVPNVAMRRRGPRIRAGATVAIEPMITLGTHESHVLDDGWTVVTADGSRGVHVEHTVAATPYGPWVLTADDGGRAELTARATPCGAPA